MLQLSAKTFLQELVCDATGSMVTTSTYDCRPYKTGNNEVCTFTPPSAGTYHIMLHGYAAYSGVLLEASYE